MITDIQIKNSNTTKEKKKRKKQITKKIKLFEK